MQIKNIKIDGKEEIVVLKLDEEYYEKNINLENILNIQQIEIKEGNHNGQ